MRSRSRWLWICLIGLTIAHHDFWLWNTPDLVFGFLPAGIAYHLLISMAASILWATAVFKVWPRDLEQWADEGSDTANEANS